MKVKKFLTFTILVFLITTFNKNKIRYINTIEFIDDLDNLGGVFDKIQIKLSPNISTIGNSIINAINYEEIIDKSKIVLYLPRNTSDNIAPNIGVK